MKQKTHKATTKRHAVTKGGKGKIKKRTAGQSHFNTRENGKVGRNKKSDIVDGNNPKINRTIRRSLMK